jgi:hypothetical protein
MVAMIFAVLLALFLIYVIYRLALGFRTYVKLRGKRLVTCPATNQTVAVNIPAATVAVEALLGQSHLRLNQCSGWPDRENCGQECLKQIEAAPEDCLVRTIVSEWYEGQQCAYCHKPFGKMKWHDPPPALIGADRKTILWNEIPAESLPDVLRKFLPVCWNCHMAESFRRQHPDLVVDQPNLTHLKKVKP